MPSLDPSPGQRRGSSITIGISRLVRRWLVILAFGACRSRVHPKWAGALPWPVERIWFR